MVFIMKQCEKCKIEILDNTAICPLCKSGLKEVNDKYTPMYPEIESNKQKFAFIFRLCIFFEILLEILLVIININTYNGLWWSLICAGVICYGWLTVHYLIQKNINYGAKILVQSIGAMAFVLLVDWVLGYSGWSVNYVIPCIVLAAYAAIIALMVVNFMNWQSYILFQIELIILGVILVLLHFFDIVTKPTMSYVTLGISVVIFIGTIVFGDKKAKTELKRRFHV